MKYNVKGILLYHSKLKKTSLIQNKGVNGNPKTINTTKKLKYQRTGFSIYKPDIFKILRVPNLRYMYSTTANSKDVIHAWSKITKKANLGIKKLPSNNINKDQFTSTKVVKTTTRLRSVWPKIRNEASKIPKKANACKKK